MNGWLFGTAGKLREVIYINIFQMWVAYKIVVGLAVKFAGVLFLIHSL